MAIEACEDYVRMVMQLFKECAAAESWLCCYSQPTAVRINTPMLVVSAVHEVGVAKRFKVSVGHE